MASYSLMILNVGNDEENHAGIKERIQAAQEIIQQNKPDILFIQDLAGKNGLKKLQLDEVYQCTELPHNQNSPYTAVLWKKESLSLWKPPKKFALKEKQTCDKSIMEQRFSSIYLEGPNGEKICVVSYHGFHMKPKFHGEGAFTDGEKKKLTRDLLNCLKRKQADAIIVGGSFNLPASETPRESVFKKFQISQDTTDFYMTTAKSPNTLEVNVNDVKALSLDNSKCLKHAPVIGKMEVNKK